MTDQTSNPQNLLIVYIYDTELSCSTTITAYYCNMTLTDVFRVVLYNIYVIKYPQLGLTLSETDTIIHPLLIHIKRKPTAG